MRKKTREKGIRCPEVSGFSIAELTIVVVIILIVVGFAIPNIQRAIDLYRLRGAGTNISGMFQTARWRAVQDDRFYSARFINQGGAQNAYTDIYPQNINGTSGNGASGPMDPKDPQITIPQQVILVEAGDAPNTGNLKSQILPSGSTVTPVDASQSDSPATFGPRGLPCATTTTNGTSSGGSATVCDSAGGLQAYWVFFKEVRSKNWEAVTITPAGRIQTWFYEGTWTLIQM